MSYKGRKSVLSRIVGTIFTSRSPRVMNRKPKPPEDHGSSKRGKGSTFGERLLEKQGLRFQYTIRGKPPRCHLDQAYRQEGNTGVLSLQTLELRLDNLAYRSGFAPTGYVARHLVSDEHIQVNRIKAKANAPSFFVSFKDSVALGEDAEKHYQQHNDMQNYQIPFYSHPYSDAAVANIAGLHLEAKNPFICRNRGAKITRNRNSYREHILEKNDE